MAEDCVCRKLCETLTQLSFASHKYFTRGEDCATGVAFTRNPSDGTNDFYGEFLVNAQAGLGAKVLLNRINLQCQSLEPECRL